MEPPNPEEFCNKTYPLNKPAVESTLSTATVLLLVFVVTKPLSPVDVTLMIVLLVISLVVFVIPLAVTDPFTLTDPVTRTPLPLTSKLPVIRALPEKGKVDPVTMVSGKVLPSPFVNVTVF